MLSDLNRAKTMRIANQVLKEQQQQLYAVQQRREQVLSQGDGKRLSTQMDNTDWGDSSMTKGKNAGKGFEASLGSRQST